MVDLAIITPTRGRPDRFAELVEAVQKTRQTDVSIWVGLDEDDTAEYDTAVRRVADDTVGLQVHVGRRRSLSAWTNDLARLALQAPDPPRYLASLGDDHRPRTAGWDRLLIEAIESLGGAPGWAYGNDLYQGANLCTSWVVSAEIVRALGWLMLPGCAHMYVDNATMAIGQAAGRIVYRPGVIVEHVHPVAGKTEWDESYRESNSTARYAADRDAFTAWQTGGGLAADLAKLPALPTKVGG